MEAALFEGIIVKLCEGGGLWSVNVGPTDDDVGQSSIITLLRVTAGGRNETFSTYQYHTFSAEST